MVSETYTIRRALPADIRPALDLALNVFAEYEMPDYAPEALENFKRGMDIGKLFIALDGEKTVGLINERKNGHISMLFVDGQYHRRGIATALMNEMVGALKSEGIARITLNASPYGMPFYEHFGFRPTGGVQHADGFVFTPMEYIF
ncbi:MAG: GNAT family N-acetyltransferase [Oscillospiraceae bacterium]|nr:GNAT family N-acetyltransferase [Oscillospiraceae bacterium]